MWYTKTVKECKNYLINKKGWTLTKRCPRMNYYYWKTNGNDSWSHSRIWTMKEMRDAVDRMQMQDWFDSVAEREKQGIQLLLFDYSEYAS